MGVREWAHVTNRVGAIALMAIAGSLGVLPQAAEAKPRACRIPPAAVSCSPSAPIATSHRSLPGQ
ncbi:hypothetical protein PGN35_001590 [Nodosilinea sp. PGN35]|uniref:hypothetical protein n=1 Tax=Nodosilinea sp. PGN35 TaxID=3020489 RepID=UPI0023B33096|nr:hypothetical protein [Nodosilinea sp. TSF1-S3]MDF0368900.1 hypothetical protein [Nodosilinea sp. TSF1-S3]